MAEGPSLRTQVANLRSKADLEAVFEHADGFLLVDQDVGAFIPELKRAEAALFPADAPLTLKSLELVTRLDMVGRAVSNSRGTMIAYSVVSMTIIDTYHTLKHDYSSTKHNDIQQFNTSLRTSMRFIPQRR